jgi:hypothetical protein
VSLCPCLGVPCSDTAMQPVITRRVMTGARSDVTAVLPEGMLAQHAPQPLQVRPALLVCAVRCEAAVPQSKETDQIVQKRKTRTALLVRAVRRAAAVPELTEEHCALAFHRLDYRLPRRHLRAPVDARRVGVAVV